MLICYCPVSWRMDNICLVRCHMGGECRRLGPSVHVVEILTDRLLVHASTIECDLGLWTKTHCRSKCNHFNSCLDTIILRMVRSEERRLYPYWKIHSKFYTSKTGTRKAKKLVHHKHPINTYALYTGELAWGWQVCSCSSSSSLKIFNQYMRLCYSPFEAWQGPSAHRPVGPGLQKKFWFDHSTVCNKLCVALGYLKRFNVAQSTEVLLFACNCIFIHWLPVFLYLLAWNKHFA